VLKYPAYSLDISPCDFHVFGPIKQALKGCTFTADDNAQEAMAQRLRQQHMEFFADGICLLLQHCNSSVNACGDIF